MSALPPLVRAVQTCRACPSQWDAWDADGQYYYLRYRGGRGSVESAASPADYVDLATENLTVAAFRHSGDLDGEISLDEFLQLAGMRLAKGVRVQ